jgi:sugar lactone lactonase YvrE
MSLLPLSACRVFFDGTLTDTQLDHPEGVAVAGDGSIWCGGERGQIYRIEPDGSAIEQVASTGGYCLGLAFGPTGDLYVCDVKHAAVLRVDTRTGEVERFADGASGRRMRNPNYPVFDRSGNLYVSDSNAMHEPGPGIYRFGPDGGGELWWDRDVDFANGLALDADEAWLYVAETFASRIFRIRIEEDGGAGERENLASLPGVLPDGLAFDADGTLLIACYEPSQIMAVPPPYTAAGILVHDREAHVLCHSTNVALRGRTLYISNLGRWHITAVELPDTLRGA